MSTPAIPLDKIITVISHRMRWRILNEFLKDDSLPASELSRRLGISLTAMCKHVKMLNDAGVLLRSYGSHYKLPPHWKIPGERALDFGAVVLRLDRLDAQ